MASCGKDDLECQICARSFTEYRRKPVGCMHEGCDEVLCLECFKKCIEDYGPRCTFCGNEISQSHIRNNCPRAFCTGPLLEKNVEIERKHQETLFLRTQEVDVALELAKRKWRKDYQFIEEQKKEPLERLRNLNALQTEMQRNYPTEDGIKNLKKDRAKFVQKCPDGNCRGYLSGSWKCGVCEKYFCSKCHVEKSERCDDHICDEDTVRTIDHIKKNSKQCPNPECGAMIQHAGGCRQMWCALCHTTFDYKTGEIDKGPIHNPEYFRWLRESGQKIPRNRGDLIPCDRIPNYYEMIRVMDVYLRNIELPDDWVNSDRDHFKIGNLVRAKNHVERVLLPKTQTDFEPDLKKMRVEYLLKETGEEEFIELIRKVIRTRERNFEAGQVYQLYITAVNETLRNIMTVMEEKEPYKKFDREFDKVSNLKKYCDGRILELRKLFGCSFKSVPDHTVD